MHRLLLASGCVLLLVTGGATVAANRAVPHLREGGPGSRGGAVATTAGAARRAV